MAKPELCKQVEQVTILNANLHVLQPLVTNDTLKVNTTILRTLVHGLILLLRHLKPCRIDIIHKLFRKRQNYCGFLIINSAHTLQHAMLYMMQMCYRIWYSGFLHVYKFKAEVTCANYGLKFKIELIQPL